MRVEKVKTKRTPSSVIVPSTSKVARLSTHQTDRGSFGEFLKTSLDPGTSPQHWLKYRHIETMRKISDVTTTTSEDKATNE